MFLCVESKINKEGDSKIFIIINEIHNVQRV